MKKEKLIERKYRIEKEHDKFIKRCAKRFKVGEGYMLRMILSERMVLLEK